MSDLKKKKDEESAELYRLVQNAVKGIKYGSVTLVIQDGKIIQIDKNEKIRICEKN